MSENFTEHTEQLTPGQEAFLFGDQGEILDLEVAHDVFRTKLGLALLWLSNHWSIPYPEELVNAEHDSRITTEEMLTKWTAEGIFDPQRPEDQVWFEMIEPKDPILHALRVEWRFREGVQTPIEDRCVLTTALVHTSEMLAGSPEIDDKLCYVVELVEQNDQNIYESEICSPWKEPMPGFPKPVDSYVLTTFPVHEVNLDLY